VTGQSGCAEKFGAANSASHLRADGRSVVMLTLLPAAVGLAGTLQSAGAVAYRYPEPTDKPSVSS
jgi:hypothetical protein